MRIVNAQADVYLPSQVSTGKGLTREQGQVILKSIEAVGRICYKSESHISEDSAEGFVRRLIERGHTSVLDHISISARVTCDRGVSHEIVRHRMAAYSQESTRYCNYSKGQFGSQVTFIDPATGFDMNMSRGRDMDLYVEWMQAMAAAEKHYLRMLELGASPQMARSVLPNSLKTELWMTYDLSEWRHFLKLRTSPAAHPQMREVADILLARLCDRIPVVFDDIYNERFGGDT